MPDESPKSLGGIIDDLLERKPIRRALMRSGEEAIGKVASVPVKMAGDEIAKRAEDFLSRVRRR